MRSIHQQLFDALSLAGIERAKARLVFSEFVASQEAANVDRAYERSRARKHCALQAFDDSPAWVSTPHQSATEFMDSLAFQPVRTESHHPVELNECGLSAKGWITAHRAYSANGKPAA